MADVYAAAAKNDPFLDEGMRGFIVRTARRQFWRVAEWYELDDLISDGYVCYYKCRNRYVDPHPKLTGTLDERRWFQALVRTTFNNYITDLAKKRTALHDFALSKLAAPDQEPEQYLEQVLEPQPESASVVAMLLAAPAELKQLLAVLTQDVSDGARQLVGKRGAKRETTNEYYCRLVGCDPGVDLVGQLKSYFG